MRFKDLRELRNCEELWKGAEVVETERGITKEVRNVVIEIPYEGLTNFGLWDGFDWNWAEERFKMIYHKVLYPLYQVVQNFKRNFNTRRAYILEPDYHPKGPPCILAYHFIQRGGKMDLNMFLRSSDFLKVLPLDLYAARRFLQMVVEQVNQGEEYARFRPGKVVAFISSLHIYIEDLENQHACAT